MVFVSQLIADTHVLREFRNNEEHCVHYVALFPIKHFPIAQLASQFIQIFYKSGTFFIY